MVVVAVAGGTGDVGRTIVTALTATGRHNVFVLSRTSAPATSTGQPPRLQVDYTNVDQIQSVLTENKIEVVICTFLPADDSVPKAQKNLIRAAAACESVTRFIPTEFYNDYHHEIDGMENFFKKSQLECEAELNCHPELTYTLVRNGLFLDYLGMPFNPKTTHLKPLWLFVDLENEICVIPGDGTNTVVFTHTTDLAAHVERLISLPAEEWPREVFIKSNELKIGEIPDIVKKATGRDFKVTFDAVPAIHEGQITQLPSNQPVFTTPPLGDLFKMIEKEVALTVLSDGYTLPGKNLSEFFPDAQKTNIEDFLRDAWAIKQSKTT